VFVPDLYFKLCGKEMLKRGASAVFPAAQHHHSITIWYLSHTAFHVPRPRVSDLIISQLMWIDYSVTELAQPLSHHSKCLNIVIGQPAYRAGYIDLSDHDLPSNRATSLMHSISNADNGPRRIVRF
jgi:hypothetical protein